MSKLMESATTQPARIQGSVRRLGTVRVCKLIPAAINKNKLATHIDQAGEDVRQLRLSIDKLLRRSDRIGSAELEA